MFVRRPAKLLFTTLLPVCVLMAANIQSDYRHSADFTQYKTYSWIAAKAQDPLWEDRIKRAVDAQLMAKGWQPVASGGDADVAAYGSTKNVQTLQTWYNGFGGGWRWGGWGNNGMATTTVQNTPVGRLHVDIFDGKSQELIWRGSATDTLSGNPEKNEKKLQKNVSRLFDKFPPKSKG